MHKFSHGKHLYKISTALFTACKCIHIPQQTNNYQDTAWISSYVDPRAPSVSINKQVKPLLTNQELRLISILQM